MTKIVAAVPTNSRTPLTSGTSPGTSASLGPASTDRPPDAFGMAGETRASPPHPPISGSPRLAGGGTIDFSKLHASIDEASRQGGQLSFEYRTHVYHDEDGSFTGETVVGAKLDGVDISSSNLDKLEALRTKSWDGGKTWQDHWKPVKELENKPGIGMRLRTSDGLGSPVESMTLRWRPRD